MYDIYAHVCVYIYLCKYIVRWPFNLELAHKINLLRVARAHIFCQKSWACWFFWFSLFVVGFF